MDRVSNTFYAITVINGEMIGKRSQKHIRTRSCASPDALWTDWEPTTTTLVSLSVPRSSHLEKVKTPNSPHRFPYPWCIKI